MSAVEGEGKLSAQHGEMLYRRSVAERFVLQGVRARGEEVAPPKQAVQSTATLVSSDNDVEVYKSNNKLDLPTPPQPSSIPKIFVEEEDPIDAVITPGNSCKHNGCKILYMDESIRNHECIYHPGVPIFHEGSKGWSCCKRKVLEFEEFLKIEGCKTGKHKFTETKKIDKVVQCRHDWYQTPTHVLFTLYAKNAKKSSQIKLEAYKLIFDLDLPNESKFVKEIVLSKPIDIDQSKIEILSTKIDLKLKKATGEQWSKLEM